MKERRFFEGLSNKDVVALYVLIEGSDSYWLFDRLSELAYKISGHEEEVEG